MIPVAPIPISQIVEGNRIRSTDPQQVEALKASILDVGLLNPITVCRSFEAYRLVAGANRLAACKAIGYDEIPCNILDLTDLERVIAECDENLCGSKLTPAEKSLFMARRKEAYEALYPETAHGGNRTGASRQLGDLQMDEHQVEHSSLRQLGEPSAKRFTADTAARTNESERVVQRFAERGEKVIPEVINLIKGTKLDTGVYLDKLKNLPPNDQVQAAKRDLAISRRADAAEQQASASRLSAPPKETPSLPSYEDLRAAILLLGNLRPEDYLTLCEPKRRAAMCSKLAQLIETFERVRESVGT